MPEPDPTNKPKTTPIEVGKASVLIFIIFYGFFAFTNPEMYPIIRNTSEYGIIDPILGLIMYISGIYVLLHSENKKHKIHFNKTE